MARVVPFSRTFPAYHPKAGQRTLFVEKIYKSLYVIKAVPKELENTFDFSVMNDDNCFAKHHTIRSGNRWKVGDKFSPRVWSGAPYRTKQIIIAPDIEIKKVWDFEINGGEFKINEKVYGGESESIFELLDTIAQNDGLDRHDLMEWFKYPKPFSGQIICWNEDINY